MKKIYISVVTALSLLVFMTGCGDFLNQGLREDLEEKDKDAFHPTAFVNSTYGMFMGWDYGFNYLGMTSIISDNADKGSSVGDKGGDKIEMDALTYTSTAGSLKDMWRNWYTTIGRANKAIEVTEAYDATPMTDADRARLIGEAKFLRAVCYFFLVRGWGDIPRVGVSESERYPVADVYGWIEQDLKDAMASLPVKYSAKDTGRATKGAAHGLLAKVYLYQGKWQDAFDAASTVMDQSVYGYKLVPDYATIWRVEGENSTESLFEIQARGDAPAHGIQQYSQSQGARGATGWGWGFNTPSQSLLDAFNAEGDDIRRDASIIFRNSRLYDGRVIGATDNERYNMKAYSSSGLGAAHTDKNLRYLRLGEIYLIKAEAANELGLLGDATTALNDLRARVSLAPTPATTAADLRTAIWKERRLELAMEHDRWFDLTRTGQAKAAMTANGKIFVVGKHELFPIPEHQLIETPTMKQNPKW